MAVRTARKLCFPLVVTVAMVALGAALPVGGAALARGGSWESRLCPDGKVQKPYHLTRRVTRRVEHEFKRHHHGYRVLTVGTSLFAPQGYVGLYYLGPAGAGGYASGGVAYYCHTRPVRHPTRDAVYGFDAVGLYSAVSEGTGTYTATECFDDHDLEGELTTQKWTVDFRWTNRWGSRRDPLAFDLLMQGGRLGDLKSSTLTGTGTYTKTNLDRADPGDHSGDYSCSFEVKPSSDPLTEINWSPVAADGRRLRHAVRIEEVIDDGDTTDGVQTGGGAGTCLDRSPEDPAADDDTMRLSFETPVVPPGRVLSGATTWKPFEGAPTLSRQAHSSYTDPDSGGTSTTDVELTVQAHTRFRLLGVSPP